MYPNEIFLGMGMYEILMVLGFFGSLLCFRIFADRFGFGVRMQNLCIVCALAALIGGYGSAVLFQAFYNALEGGGFVINANTGATFYGGLIGGVAVFLLVYFVAGRFLLEKGETVKNFPLLADIAAPAIAVAHGMGRLGCLFAGCCHGRVTTAWYGIYNAYLHQKTVPLQLFEAIFLFALCALLILRLLNRRKNNLAVYLMAYAIWRFLLEFWRADDRGASPLSFLSPSQFIAVILFLVGAGMLLWSILRARKDGKDAA